MHRCITQDGLSPADHSTEEQLCYDVSINASFPSGGGVLKTFFSHNIFHRGLYGPPQEAIGPDGSNCFSRGSVPVCLFVCFVALRFNIYIYIMGSQLIIFLNMLDISIGRSFFALAKCVELDEMLHSVTDCYVT